MDCFAWHQEKSLAFCKENVAQQTAEKEMPFLRLHVAFVMHQVINIEEVLI